MKEKIAIITYNRIGEGQYANGILKKKGKELHLFQNGHLSKWAVNRESGIQNPAPIRAQAITDILEDLNLEDMDKVYLYVGTSGSEKAIEMTKKY